MRERYGATNERSWYMKTHVQTAGCSLTEQQPLNNIVRVAYQAMAAGLGGCQSLHTDSMDETLGLPTEQAVTVALRTQQILAHETGITRTVDPLGGSWFIESLTDRMEAEAMDLIREIDGMGTYRAISDSEPVDGDNSKHPGYMPTDGYGQGVVSGINKGYFRRHIAEASYRFSEECEAKDRIIVGVNEYTDGDDDRQIDILTIPDSVETEQVRVLSEFKANRDSDGAAKALDAIRDAARAGENVMPSLVDGALANCTLGEMVQAMADVYGRYAGGPEW
ncbi:MAG: methylmalonyl-CoA mutase family protein [Planctomycetota bacterium]